MHLWYLSALVYTLVIVAFVDKISDRKLLYYLIPLLLLGELAFGKYSMLIFHRTYQLALVRNFLFVGIPYFCIGDWLYVHRDKVIHKWSNPKLILLVFLFCLTTIAEKVCCCYYMPIRFGRII